MTISSGYLAFKMSTEISPIILTGGIATGLGSALPILVLTESAASLTSGVISSGANPLAILVNTISTSLTNAAEGADLAMDNFFAHFYVMAGSTLINQQIARYPFANQAVAANATISQPLNVSMKMVCPVRDFGGYAVKFATISSLQKSLSQHNSLGGLYSVMTPSYIYTNCIMTGMRDISAGETKQSQYAYQLDFEQPLVTLQAATQAQNGLLNSITQGTPLSGTSAAASGLPIGNPTSSITESLTPGYS